MAERLLDVSGLKKYYPIKKNLLGKPGAYVKAVNGVDFFINKGCFLIVKRSNKIIPMSIDYTIKYPSWKLIITVFILCPCVQPTSNAQQNQKK